MVTIKFSWSLSSGLICNCQKEVEKLLAEIDSRVIETIEKITEIHSCIEDYWGIEAKCYEHIHKQHGYIPNVGFTE